MSLAILAAAVLQSLSGHLQARREGWQASLAGFRRWSWVPVGRVMGMEFNRAGLNGSGRTQPSAASKPEPWENPAAIAGRFAARPVSAVPSTPPSPAGAGLVVEPVVDSADPHVDPLADLRPVSHRRPPDRRLTLGGLAAILFAAVTLYVAIQMSGYFERQPVLQDAPKLPATGLAARGSLR